MDKFDLYLDKRTLMMSELKPHMTLNGKVELLILTNVAITLLFMESLINVLTKEHL